MLKSFFFDIYLLIFNFSFYLVFFMLLSSSCLLYFDLRKKFIFFIITIILFSIFGFLFDLDGIFLIFLTAEFTIFLLLLMTYTQLYNNYSFLKSQIYFYPIIFFFIILLQATPVSFFFGFTSYYKTLTNIVSGDFYILYYFLFDQVPVITIILILIISFFSLFFITMYFSLKLVKSFLIKNFKYIYFLRKQNLIKQTLFLNKVYTFQN